MLLLRTCLAGKYQDVLRLSSCSSDNKANMGNNLMAVLASILDAPNIPQHVELSAYLPLSLGGLGLPNPSEVAHSAYTVSVSRAYQSMRNHLHPALCSQLRKTLLDEKSMANSTLKNHLEALAKDNETTQHLLMSTEQLEKLQQEKRRQEHHLSSGITPGHQQQAVLNQIIMSQPYHLYFSYIFTTIPRHPCIFYHEGTQQRGSVPKGDGHRSRWAPRCTPRCRPRWSWPPVEIVVFC
jgi:hypothetical protein